VRAVFAFGRERWRDYNVVQRGVWDMCLGGIPWVGEGREAIIAFPESFLRSLPIELLRLHSWHSGWNIIDHTFGCGRETLLTCLYSVEFVLNQNEIF